jgi:hypothetical protein
MNQPLFEIIFDNNSVFTGGDLKNTKWTEIPANKKIRTIFYMLPAGDYIGIGGFDKIYQYLEVTTDLNGINAGKIIYEYAYLILDRNNQFEQYRINLKNRNIDFSILEKEKIEKLNPLFWRG